MKKYKCGPFDISKKGEGRVLAIFKKNRYRVTKILAILLSIMLATYQMPFQLLANVFASTEDHPNVFTMEILNDGTPVAKDTEVSLKSVNRWVDLEVTGYTDENGVVSFPEITEATFSGNVTFDLTVAGSPERTISLRVGTTDHYIYDISTDQFTYPVTLHITGNGTVQVDDTPYTENTNLYILENTDINLTMTPNTGYEIKSIQINGVEETVKDKENFTKKLTVTGPVHVNVEFQIKTYTISFTTGKNGDVTNELGDSLKGGTVTVEHGKETTFIVKPSKGYHFNTIKYDNHVLEFDQSGNLKEIGIWPKGFRQDDTELNKFTIQDVTDNHTIHVTFEKNLHEITVDKTGKGDGTVFINGKNAPIQVDEFTEVKVEIHPKKSSFIKSVTFGDEVIPVEDGSKFTHTFDPITEATELKVEFSLKTYIVTFHIDGNGEVTDENQEVISDGGTVTVQYGDHTTFITNAAFGHHLAEIQLDDDTVKFLQDGSIDPKSRMPDGLVRDTENPNKFIIEDIQQDHTVKVTFAINKYSVTAIGDDNGTVYLDREEVEHNGAVTITMEPKDPSFQVAFIEIRNPVTKEVIKLVNKDKIEETEDGQAFRYTEVNIQQDLEIAVTFESVPDMGEDWQQYIQFEGELIAIDDSTNTHIYSNQKNATIGLTQFAKEDYHLINVHYSHFPYYSGWKKNFTITDNTTVYNVFMKKNIHDRKKLDLNNLNVVFDTLAPELEEPVINPVNKPAENTDETWYKGPVIVNVSVINGTQTFNNVAYSTEIDKVYYSKGEKSEETKQEAIFDERTNTYVFTTPNENYSGKYSIWAVDKAGNESEVKEVGIHTDITPPSLIGGDGAVIFEQTNDHFFAEAINFLTFGTFFKKGVKVTVHAEDNGSGVHQIQLLANDSDADIEKKNANTFIIQKEKFEGTLTVKLSDKVGNVGSYTINNRNSNMIDDSGIVIVDNVAPTTVINMGREADYGGNQYNSDVDVHVTGEDLDSGLNRIKISVNNHVVVDEYYHESLTNEKTHTLNSSDRGIQANEDGSYHIKAEVGDNAGNKKEVEKTIYIDRTKPRVIEYYFNAKGKDVNTGDLDDSVVLTEYGYFFKDATRVTVKMEDPKVKNEFTSGVKSATIYLKDEENGKFYAVLSNGTIKEIKESQIIHIKPVSTNGTFSFTIPKSFKGQIFTSVIDKVNNESAFFAPDGTIIEFPTQHAKEKHIDFQVPKTSLKDNQNLDLYNRNVNIDLTVTDTYSGISEIEWSVVAPYDTANNQSGSLKINKDKSYATGSDTAGWKQTKTEKNLVTEMKKTITVSNNSNGIVARVKMTDRAGNVTEEDITFSIDKTAPSINVTYDNNSPDSEYTDYFNENRTATIVITERNFKEENVKVTITNTDGSIPTINGWTTRTNSQNPDLTTHTATVVYSADGDYTFDLEYTDNAGNKAAPFDAHSFTIDKTDPVVNVSYNNNAAQNGNYYNQARTATIAITEHNFDPSRVQIIGSAEDEGAEVAFPGLSGWSSNGDVHTATITYAQDATYRFDIEFMDMAGNVIADFPVDEFIIDQTAPEVTITGVEDKSANNGEVAPIISYTDKNFNPDQVSIELSGANRGQVELNGNVSNTTNGQVFTFENFAETKENDDIYTLTATVSDLAGNVTEETIQFSVNRFGSVYAFAKELQEINGKYVQQERDVVVTETNVDSLKEDSILIKLTKNGTPTDLVEGTDYTVEETGGDGQWSQYTYTMKKELFAGDGRYTVTLYSEDQAGNINENIDEEKKAEISFGIDKTAPVIVPINVENGEQYPVDTKEATFSIKDNLVLEGATFYLNGKEMEHQEDGENYTINIPSSNSTQDVKVVAVDAAGNEFTTEVKDVLVSTNLFVRWYNNTPVFIGSLSGLGVLAIALTTFLVLRIRKRGVEKVKVQEN
jgi:Bacterial Ig-like domain (group 3)/Divergent InlB B-repeat domain/Bacterial Ig-like domain